MAGIPQKPLVYSGEDLEAMLLAKYYYRWVLRSLAPYIGESVVEVGAGVGSFSKLLLELGPKQLTLIEPSTKMFRLLKKSLSNVKGKIKLDLQHKYLKDVLPNLKGQRRPDTVIYINVLEHVADDQLEIKRAASILKKHGHLLIFVPAMPSLYSHFDKNIGHYRRYEKARLERLCKNGGLQVIKAIYMDSLGVIPWWLSFRLIKRKTLSPTVVKLYDALCVPVVRVVESRVHPPFGKNLLLVARKA
ncbi:methyltransferase domain-containing protein [Candidatus Microgenomates bacterium]|nr:methyltransferase domain-containing protein [Candidatus Microgenomates bacterium]